MTTMSGKLTVKFAERRQSLGWYFRVDLRRRHNLFLCNSTSCLFIIYETRDI